MHQTAAEIASAAPLSERSAGDLALQGWASIYDGFCPENLERAQQYFEQAVEKDPSNLGGCAGSASAPTVKSCMTGLRTKRRLDDECSTPHRAWSGSIHMTKLTALASGSAADINGRWDLRLSIGDRLCERDPADPTAHTAHGIGLLRLGRFDESLAAFDKARSLSIEDFREGLWYSLSACAQLMSGRHGLAARAAQQAIAANACLPLPHLLLAAALAGDGKTAEAREVLRQHLAREANCNRSQVELLLAGGNRAYEAGRARIIATLLELGVPDA